MEELSHNSEQRMSLEQLLKPIHNLIEEVLSSHHIDHRDIDWTYMRWDVLDINAAWPKKEPNRIVHAWLDGTGPTYLIKLEGAAWKDTENESCHVRLSLG